MIMLFTIIFPNLTQRGCLQQIQLQDMTDATVACKVRASPKEEKKNEWLKQNRLGFVNQAK